MRFRRCRRPSWEACLLSAPVNAKCLVLSSSIVLSQRGASLGKETSSAVFTTPMATSFRSLWIRIPLAYYTHSSLMVTFRNEYLYLIVIQALFQNHSGRSSGFEFKLEFPSGRLNKHLRSYSPHTDRRLHYHDRFPLVCLGTEHNVMAQQTALGVDLRAFPWGVYRNKKNSYTTTFCIPYRGIEPRILCGP